MVSWPTGLTLGSFLSWGQMAEATVLFIEAGEAKNQGEGDGRSWGFPLRACLQ